MTHEFGHFIAAKRNGVKVNEFGIGFPPRAVGWYRKDGKWHKLTKKDWDKPREETIWSINWLPIGGFCSMDGESAIDHRPHTFGAANFWQKTKILFAGVAFNWLVAFIILTILAFTGMPRFISNQFFIGSDLSVEPRPVVIGEVKANSPAEKAGLKSGELISAINGEPVIAAEDIVNYNAAHSGETVTYTVLECAENCPSRDVSVTLNPADAEYALGVTMSETGQTLYRSTWSAPLVGAVTTVQLTGETFRGLGEMLAQLCSGLARQLSFDSGIREQGRADIGKVGDSVSGPVGIIGIIFPAFTSAGPTNLAFLAALISVSLACMNVLPIPALDGGRWLLIAIYKLRKKPLDPGTEGRIVSRAFLVLILLIILITILDVIRIVG